MKINFTKIIKNLINKTGLMQTRFYIKYFRMRRGSEKIEHLLEQNRKERFIRIYSSGVWLNNRNTGSLSGYGSEIKNTENLRKNLPELIKKLEINKLLDIGCGDWTWMQKIKLPCEYIGVDIVPFVINENIKKHSSPTIRFEVLDAVEDNLPDCDAILIREVLFHLSFYDAKKIIKNIVKSKAKYVFITSDPDVQINKDIRSGDFRMINLYLEPFYFPLPELTFEDDGVSSKRIIGVWNKKYLRE